MRKTFCLFCPSGTAGTDGRCTTVIFVIFRSSMFSEILASCEWDSIRPATVLDYSGRAILEARELLEAADFGSIGTNDLVQFVFAVDRNNERVAEDYFFDRPVLWKLIEDLVRTANEVGRPLSLCGELAAEPRFTERLISMGISAISVSARHIPTVRRAARQALHKKLQTHV